MKKEAEIMHPEIEDIMSQPFQFVVYHVGGGDNAIGPPEQIMRALPDHALLVVFEIRSDNSDPVELRTFKKTGQKMLSVNRGVDIKSAKRQFYVNKFPLSSSLLESSPIARDDDPGYPFCHTWGENTEIDEEITVDVSPLDQIIDEFKLPSPDFLSIDAQGAELNILKGATKAFSEHIIGAVTEVEFSEIYSKQALFDEQMSWYSTQGMRLVQIFNQQDWHPGPRMPGQAFLTVGEALFIKYVHLFEDGEDRPSRAFVELDSQTGIQLLKIMAVARSFKMLSYATKIAQFVLYHRPEMIEVANNVPILKECLELGDYVTMNHSIYEQDKDFFMKSVTMVNT